MGTSFQRLSSGLRINSAKDDAAGLSISERMTSQIRGINQAVQNAGDGVSLAQTAEGALQETTNILQRMRELSVQSANDTNTTEDRGSIQQEMDALTSELDRIAEKTTFNNQKILDGSFAGAKFHIGANSGESLTVNVKDARAGSLGRMARIETSSVGGAAIGGAANDGLSLKSDDGSFHVVRQTALTDDTVSTVGNDNSAIAIAAAINDSTKFHGVSAQATASQVNMGAISAGNFDNAANLTINGEQITGVSVQIDDADGTLVDAINAVTDKTGVVATIGDDNGLVLTAEDGRNIEVVNVGAPAGIGAAGTEVTRGGVVLQADNNIVIGDGTGAAIAVGGQEQNILGLGAGNTTIGKNTDFAVNTIDVTSRSGANEAIDILDQALKQVTQSRSGLGAVQNRMEATVRNLEATSENLSASRGRIQDADFAKETATFSKNQIMQQAGVNILAQANQAPNLAMQLLG
jgi:flagellin